MERRRLRRLVRALLLYLSETMEEPPSESPASDNLSPLVDNATKKEDARAVAAPAQIQGMDRVEFRARRKSAGVTMAQAGALLGVTERTISGGQPPDQTTGRPKKLVDNVTLQAYYPGSEGGPMTRIWQGAPEPPEPFDGSVCTECSTGIPYVGVCPRCADEIAREASQREDEADYLGATR